MRHKRISSTGDTELELIDSIKPKDFLRGIPSALSVILGIYPVARFLLKSRKDTNKNYPLFFEHMACQFADNTLIKFHNASYTYREFNERCNQIAHYLVEHGIESGDVVALYMENRPEYLLYLTAISKTGATAALVNNSQTHKVLLHSINLVSPKAIISGEEVIQNICDVKSEITTQLPLYIVPDADSDWAKNNNDHSFVDIHEETLNGPRQNLARSQDIKAESPALYVYTSGTTGLPKASIQSHNKIVRTSVALGMVTSGIKETDTLYCCLPFYHATAFYMCWSTAVANGATTAIRRKFSASNFWSDIHRFDATVFIYIGELCRYLLNQEPTEQENNHNIRMVIGNGLRPELWDEFQQRFRVDRINEFYGSSEGNVSCLNLFNQKQTMGFCVGPHAIVKLDIDTEEPLRDSNGYLIKTALGEPGLLLGKITALAAFEGYTDKEKNASKIITDAFHKGDKWFNTGDIVKNLGFRHLQFVDRSGDTFRWKGENVSTGEVEMIANLFPGIAECVAYGVEIPNTNGRAGMVAVIPKDSGAELDTDAFYAFLKSELPSYAVPIFIRTLSSVDATGTFKYQRSRLKQQSYLVDSFEHKADKAYVALPGTNSYQVVDANIIEGIKNNQYRF